MKSKTSNKTAVVSQQTEPSREVALRQTALSWPDKARTLAVIDQATYDQAAEALRGIKALRLKADETFDVIIKKAHEAHAAACAEKNKVVAPLIEAERILKSSRTAWWDEQERLRLEEQDRLEREAQERAEADRQRELEAAKARGASRKEVKAIAQQPVFAAPVEAPPTALKSEGLSQRANWKGAVDDLAALVDYVAANKEFLGLLEPNQTAVNSMARALKSTMKIPGIRVWNAPVESVRV